MTQFRSKHDRLSLLLAGALLCACGSEGEYHVESTPPEPTPALPPGSTAAPAPARGEANDPAPAGPTPTSSRCELSPDTVKCSSHELSLKAKVVPRKVFYEVPLGTPPAKGWPVVFFFQGSFFPAPNAFEGNKSDPFGRYDLALTVKELLDHGYAILAPNAPGAGTTAWETNVPPWMVAWETSSDHAFMLSIFEALDLGAFGPLDGTRLYATGISSGGFMTSRMAISYAGKFKALAVHSASYATCGAVCLVPAPLPSDHPPTLFLHGGQDLIVRPSTMESYRDELTSEGRKVKTVVDPDVGHAWLPAGPNAVRTWFDENP
ncbi:MAG: Dipeptidyl aminopeptidase/acylaminoacyl-peptidase [Labilithrix sp.]|nr:Dipeptidyl aminopeptidase/acylaminoacyl-peptidase [Labilithrix sp.]